MLAKNDEKFFQTETRGPYTRTGAKDVIGLSLYQYQQLLRYPVPSTNNQTNTLGPTKGSYARDLSTWIDPCTQELPSSKLRYSKQPHLAIPKAP